MRFDVCVYIITLVLVVFGTTTTFAAGATSPSSGALAGKVTGNAWYRDGAIQVIVCNTSESPQPVRVVIGVYDTAPRGFFQQRLTVAHDAASQLTFPEVKQKSPRGDMETANFIFIYSGDDPEELVASLPIQNRPDDRQRPVPDQYLAWDGDVVTLSFAVASDPNLRLFAFGKGIQTSGVNIPGQLSPGSLSPASADDIRMLDLPGSAKKQYIKRLEEEFVFILKPGDSEFLAVDYEMPAAKDCAIVILPVYQTNMGGGEGTISSTLLVLNKQNVVFHPVLSLEPVSVSKRKTKSVN